MDKIKKELNKWQMTFYYGRAFETFDGRMVRFGIFNIQRFPEMGEPLDKKYYKGFVFTKRFRHPLTLLRKYLEKKNY